MDYIFYSVVTGTNVPVGQNGTCTDSCSKGLNQQKCCASVYTSFEDTCDDCVGDDYERNTISDYWYACVDKSLAAVDMTMRIAGHEVTIACVESGAMRVAKVAMTAALALFSIM